MTTPKSQAVTACFEIASKRFGCDPIELIRRRGKVPNNQRMARLVLKYHLYRAGMDWHEIGKVFEVKGDSVRDTVNRQRFKIRTEYVWILRKLPCLPGLEAREEI
jgi:hypothetical protein